MQRTGNRTKWYVSIEGPLWPPLNRFQIQTDARTSRCSIGSILSESGLDPSDISTFPALAGSPIGGLTLFAAALRRRIGAWRVSFPIAPAEAALRQFDRVYEPWPDHRTEVVTLSTSAVAISCQCVSLG